MNRGLASSSGGSGSIWTLLWPLIVLLIVLYVVYTLILYIRGMSNEAFTAAVARRPFDIGTFLAAREIYDNFWNREGRRICGDSEEPLCKKYGAGSDNGSGSGNSNSNQAVYSPPRLDATGPTTLTDASFRPLTVDDVTLENAVFTYYRAEPTTTTFRTADEYAIKTDVERFIDEQVGVTRSQSTAAAGSTVADYTCYIRINGLNYRVVKDIGGGAAKELLSCSKVDPASRRPIVLYAAAGPKAPSTYKQTPISDQRLFEIMLTADSQNALEGQLASAAASAIGAATGSATASAETQQTAANLQLPPLRYVENGWLKNSDLFKQMYDSLAAPTTAITNYFRSANIRNTNNTFVTTLNKFVELDKRILRAAGTTGQPPKTRSGNAYRFLIPNAYNPTLQLLGDNYEEPAVPAKYMKCYDLSAQESALVNYFKRGRGSVENPGVSSEALASKVQGAICASYGYYSAATAEGLCNCTGCCIPVNYKPRAGVMAGMAAPGRLAAAADDASAEILSKVDNCVHISQPFQIRRTGPVIKMAPTCVEGLETEEGFMDLPANYGLTRGHSSLRDAFTDAKGAVIGARDMQWRAVI
jgi:hypothetical protein